MESCLADTCTSAAAGTSTLIFTQLVQTLLTAQCSLNNQRSYPPDRTEEILGDGNLEFDFIIVGAGTAGSVLASRLSEISKWRILLIERGEDPSLTSDIPGLMTSLYGGPEDYDYKVEFDKRFCQSMQNKQCTWPRGKALGGSSAINAMVHIHGNDRDYNQWAQMSTEDWNFENVLPYFRKSENYHPDIIKKYGGKFFGTGGPVNIRPFNFSSIQIHDILLNAAKELALPNIDMPNIERYIGFSKIYGTIDNGIRQNAARAYLIPIKDRTNLYVIKSTRVNSVKLKRNRATGVEAVLKNGRKIVFKASKEVILSAGSLASPQILMLSGIGPKSELELHNISVVADLPVGRNLQDHLIWPGILFKFTNKTLTPPVNTSIFDSVYEYLMHRTGSLSLFVGVGTLGFINTKNPLAKYPNIQIFFIHVRRNDTLTLDGVRRTFYYDSEVMPPILKLNQKYDLIIPFIILLNPLSIGHLSLPSSNPEDPIKIHANYFDSEEDLNVYLESVHVMKKFSNTNTFKKFGIELTRFELPECDKYLFDSRNYWECNLRHTASTIYHPVGTCKMGLAANDSVVDPNLKVHNIKGLRVIDASIMPKITSGNTNSPTLMIAEKGSDFIKTDWLAKVEL